MSELREALRYAREALPAANERETVICAIEGTHLRALVDALSAEPAQPKALTDEQVGALCYQGNTVSYMYARAKVYGDEVMRCWFVLKDAGLHPGRADDTLHEVIKRALADRACRLPEMGEGDWPEKSK